VFERFCLSITAGVSVCTLGDESLAEQGSEKGKKEPNGAIKTSLKCCQFYLELENLLRVLCLN